MMYSITDIEKNYPNWYDQTHVLSKDDQKFIWENTPFTEEREGTNEIDINKDVTAYESVPGTYKQQANLEQSLSKSQAVTALSKCNYRTPSKEIAPYLEILFGSWKEKPNHWLYIAQHYTPKTINSVLWQMIKACRRGDISLKVPGAYFTSIIKHKLKRKVFRGTNGICKQKEDNNVIS